VTLRRVLVELSVTEQRYRAVLEVQAGVAVTEVAERFGVSWQGGAPVAVLVCRRGLGGPRWPRWYVDEGLDGLADRSSGPHCSPGQTWPEVEALICELRRAQRRELGEPLCRRPRRYRLWRRRSRLAGVAEAYGQSH
jgi:hypothetical protein